VHECQTLLRAVAAEEGVTGVLTPPDRLIPLATAQSDGGGAVGHYGAMRQRFTAARCAELDAEGRALVVGTERICLPRHVSPFNSINNGLQCGYDDVAGIICQALLATSCDSIRLKKPGSTIWRMTWQA
jgi:hypothetical protein